MAVPSVVKGITVLNPRDGVSLDVVWSSNPELDVVGYNVYRALSPVLTEMVKLNSSLITISQFHDPTALQKINTIYYYSVTAVNTLSEESPLSPAVFFNPQAVGYMLPKLNEIIRRHYIMMKFDGELVTFLIRKTAGERCSCFDVKKRQITIADCPECFGTSYKGGFEKIQSVKMRIRPAGKTMKLSEWGLMIDNRPQGWVSTFPIVRNGDILVRASNKRYELQDYLPQEHQGMLTFQEFRLQEFEPKFRSIYEIPV